MGMRTDLVLGGRYRLGGLLGRGGMAEVYEATDERLRRRVAVKVLRADMAASPDVRRRFEAEARAAASLSHANTVAVFDTGEDTIDAGPVAWIVMELLPGDTLADRMRSGPLPADDAVRIAGDVLGALGAAHSAGIIHRDIKPGNILFDGAGRARLADFGIAKSIEVDGDATHTGVLVGTPSYLAPERVDGEPATRRSDLYSLGVVLYEAIAGEKPFTGTTPVGVAYAIRHTRPRPLHELRPDVPSHVVDAVHRAMDPDPSRRFPSAETMAAALRSGIPGDTASLGGLAADDATLVLTTPGGAPPQVGDTPRHRRYLVAVAVALLCLLAAGAVLLGDTEPAEATLADRLRDAAGGLREEDGTSAGDAAERLRELAGLVDTASAAAGDRANALLRDLAIWESKGELDSAVVARLRALVLEVPGADPASFAVPTTVPPRDRDDKDDDKGGDKDDGKDDEKDDDKDDGKGGEGGGKGRDGGG